MRLSLGASSLNVRNLDHSQEFYQNVFEFRPVAHGDLDETRIHDLMTARRTVINPTTSIPDAAAFISRGYLRHLPVSGDTGLAGMLDVTDVCRPLIDPDLSQRPTTSNAPSR
jgi:CBS domain-containing protein